LPEPRSYPAWLAEAWAKCETSAQFDDLLAIERSWRDGSDEAMLKERAAQIVARPLPPSPRPVERSLALLPQPPEELLQTVRRVAYLHPPPAPDIFFKDTKPTPSLSAALVAVASDDVSRLPAIASLLAVAEPRPETEETLLLLRLARLDLPTDTLRLVLQTHRDLHRLYEPLGFARRRTEVEQLAQSYHNALVLLESRGYAPANAPQILAAMQNPLAALLARQADEVAAERTLAEARQWFREARASGLQAELPRALERYAQLQRQLSQSPSDLRDATAALRQSLDKLAEPFSPQGVARRLLASKRGDSPQAWRELDRLLAATRTANRVAVYAAAQDLGRRLEEENARRDNRDGSRLVGIPELVPPAVGPPLPLPPPPPPDHSLWAWLADRYRYEYREALGLDPHSLAADFFRRAALDYQTWLDRPRETYAEVIQANDPPRLLPNEPITLQLNIRVQPTGPFDLEILRPDDQWLRLSPERPIPDAQGQFAIQVGLHENAGTGQPRPPLGVLARATLAGRSYHRRISLSLSPRVPQVVLAPLGIQPGEMNGPLALRPIAGRQSFVLYVRNPIDQPWSKLAVQLSLGGETRESLPLALGGLETKPVAFAPSTAPLPPVLPEVRELGWRVVNLDAKNEVVSSGTLALTLAPPESYARITALDYDPLTARLAVRLRQRGSVAGPAVKAELQIPAPEQGGATFRDGTLRGTLSPKGEELTLFANGVAGAGEARFAVGIDGWARAFSFRATLTPRGGRALPEPLTAPAIRLASGPYGIAGPAFRVPLEVDQAPLGAAVEVSLGRLVGGAFRIEVTARREGGRDERIGAALLGSTLQFEASQRDWVVPLDTSLLAAEN
ncbi:MAG: hypothetical protein SNJ82_12165, partial [Gemmataceae bacterium]